MSHTEKRQMYEKMVMKLGKVLSPVEIYRATYAFWKALQPDNGLTFDECREILGIKDNPSVVEE